MTAANSAWILQANPREWDVGRFMSDVRRGRTTRETNWLTPTLSREIAVGDRVFLWVSGNATDAGVIALATVMAEAAEVPEDKPEYRMPGFEDKYGPPRTRVRIRIDAPLKFHLSRRLLKTVAGLEGLSILSARPQGTVFRVDPEEAQILEHLCVGRTAAIEEAI
jgi:predicted RNA-binding protein with PUA-like domain